GWFTAGLDGTADKEYEIEGDFVQVRKQVETFENTGWNLDWCYLRHPQAENYELADNRLCLHGSKVTLDEVDSPTFIGIRQKDFNFTETVEVTVDVGEAGITVYSCENEHYDLAIRRAGEQYEAVLKLNIGGIKHEQSVVKLSSNKATLIIHADNFQYNFFVSEGAEEIALGCGQVKYLSSEVSGGFTGVVLGLYAVGENTAVFEKFEISYTEE
ncbi:MAG: glycoside hydrolase family 43 protein, partial [Lachnospiraceae bacterium]|nr:glycoside hydrolase family 43 protein [Lachnospiraceae bacterium]